MKSGKSDQKAVTPGSVKMLMLVEAAIIAILSYWVMSEYAYNSYFHAYFDQALVSQVTTYAGAISVGISLVSGAAATTVYMKLRRGKHRLEAIALPKIKGAVEKVIPTLPGPNALSPSTISTDPASAPSEVSSRAPTVVDVVPVPESREEKK